MWSTSTASLFLFLLLVHGHDLGNYLVCSKRHYLRGNGRMTVLEVLQKMRSSDRALVLANISGVDTVRDFEVHTHIEKYDSEYREMNVVCLTPTPIAIMIVAV